MNGFAPLIEGFLAFALTMLALTTGVSAIVGAINQVRRKHARGLRDMVRLLYLREIVPLEGEGKPAATSGPDGTPGDALAPGASRAKFIYDMTFMPLPVVVERLETNGPDYWRNQLESAEWLSGERWYHVLAHPRRVGRYWRSLRYSLQCLQDGEFRERLTCSDAGVQLKAREAWKARGLADWDALVEQLLKRFQVLGAASSETFARYSRGWCVAVGFVLAAMLNIDSLDLLNSYLTDPGLRQRVLDRSEAIMAPERPESATDGGTVAAPARARFDAASAQLTSAARELSGTLETIRASATGEGAAVAKDVAAQLEKVAAQVKDVQSGVSALETDVTQADQRIRGVTRALTTSFPIGWKRFPNCAAMDSPDVRCEGRAFARRAAGAAPGTALAALVAAPARWSSVLMTAQTADPDAFNQWVLGVLLTGLMLGLGTPFWVQAVSTAFNLRRWDQRKADTANTVTTANGDGAQKPPAARGVSSGAGTPAGA